MRLFQTLNVVSITMQNPCSFINITTGILGTPCMSRITIILLNCKGPHITVNNDTFGRFQDSRLHMFVPTTSERLLSATKQKLKPLPPELRLASVNLYQQRMKLNRTLSITVPKLNSFQIPPEQPNRFDNTRNWFFEADADRVRFRPIPSKTNKKTLIRKLSPHQWNLWCDSHKDKITGVPESPLEMHCSKCGVFGHTLDICWQNLKSKSEMQLGNPTDKALCDFLLSIRRAKPLVAPTGVSNHAQLCSLLFQEISNRACSFRKRWRSHAKRVGVPHTLFVDTFSQIRAGLPFWYALGATKLQLQWVAFGAPLPAYKSLQDMKSIRVFRYQKNGQMKSDSPFTIEKVKKWAARGSVTMTPLKYCGNLTPLFVKESSNKDRLIADFRQVNTYLYQLNYNLIGADHFSAFGDPDDLFISTDFSSFWEQLRLQNQFQRVCASCITVKGQRLAFWPSHGMFGLSNIPFFANHIMKPVIAAFNLVGVASIWVDDLFCKVGNLSDPFAARNCEATVLFIAKILSALRLRQNTKKADFSPSTIKAWVGQNVCSKGNFILIDKLLNLLDTCNIILSKSYCSFKQLESLNSKLLHYGTKRAAFLLQELSLEKNRILQNLSKKNYSQKQIKNFRIHVGERFRSLCLTFMNFLIAAISEPSPERFNQTFHLATDASDQNFGFTLSKMTPQGLSEISAFECHLPVELSAHQGPTREFPSSTFQERHALLMSLSTTQEFFSLNPNSRVLVFTDSATLTIELLKYRSKSIKGHDEIRRIFTIVNSLKNSNIHINFLHHSRETHLGKLADSLTRAVFPTPSKKLVDWAFSFPKKAIIPVNLHELFTNTRSYLKQCKKQILLFPINVQAKRLYSNAFYIICNANIHCSILAPKLNCFNTQSNKFTTGRIFSFSKNSKWFVHASDTLRNRDKSFAYGFFETKIDPIRMETLPNIAKLVPNIPLSKAEKKAAAVQGTSTDRQGPKAPDSRTVGDTRKPLPVPKDAWVCGEFLPLTPKQCLATVVASRGAIRDNLHRPECRVNSDSAVPNLERKVYK